MGGEGGDRCREREVSCGIGCWVDREGVAGVEKGEYVIIC